ncbi:MAG: hypothetical protein E7385_05590 [Ruminococcaceae bacterium]|nr:hypothetical protein [Oscillospiraceae bacterium]
MKKRSKFIVIFLVLILGVIVALSACGDDNSNPKPTANPTANPTAALDPTIEPTAVITPTPSPTQEPTPRPEPTPKGDHSGGIISEDPVEALLFETGDHLAYSLTDYPMAIQFYATTSFDGLKLSCHNGNNNIGTVVFSLYEWQYTYEETIEQSEPIETVTFENYGDNHSLHMQFSQVREDGEYLLVVTTPDPSEGVGVWYLPSTPHDAQHVFFEDLYNDYASVEYFILCYTKTPQNLYGPLTEVW